ncbi:Golgin subfamily A member 5 [Mytilus edulis]|uniref:Golgin subfamily A member 5 n=1 Tax=Mytilus edulis TaxID=6550 RepID=A0A8S3Q686_MYTED|nr:Golgin subfamily A member 5 [Mytilus edulis]
MPFCKEKVNIFLKSENATKFENLTAFKQYIECYCGIKESAVEKGLGSFTLKLARHTKSAGVSTETFSINTQQQWQNERTMLQQQYNTSSLLGTRKILKTQERSGMNYSDVLVIRNYSLGPRKKVDNDEALFDFLNSSEPLDTSKKKVTPTSSARHSRHSSTSSVLSNKGGKITENPPSSNSGSSIVHVDSIHGSGSERGSPSETDVNVDVATLAEAMLDQSPSNSVHSSQDHESNGETQTLSSLELENKLLKNEVQSLNQEMSSVVNRAKEAEMELLRLKKKMDEYNRSSSKHDHVLRELQTRESDLMEVLNAKDSQLAVLRIRLEEADKNLQSSKKEMDRLQGEKSRILQDHTDSSGMHSQALDSLKQKLAEVEDSLKAEQQSYKQAQQESVGRQEKKASDDRTKVKDLTNQLKLARHNLDCAKQELAEYKEKATRILQSKERLIASLREGSGASGESVGVSNLEYDSVKQERDMFREELQHSRMTAENLGLELQEIESQLQQDNDSANEQIRSMEENLQEEKRIRLDFEQEILNQKQELQYTVEEMSRQKTAFQNKIADREADIEKLQNQLTTKTMSSSTEGELESRVRSLTESLIQKQTMLESLSTEKNSLTLQLERLQQQYKDIQSSSLRTNTTVVQVHEEDDVRQRLPAFMRETPTDAEVTKKMKRAVSTIDKFSIRLGVFLRRNPMSRIFIILYMVLLHVWVMVVLMTYQPEIHATDSKQPRDPQT